MSLLRFSLLTSVALPAFLTVAAISVLPTAASAAEETAGTPAALGARGATFTLVDSQGRVAGELVTEGNNQFRLITATPARSVQPATPAPSAATFQPNYVKALTPEQMSAAWHAEFKKFFTAESTLAGQWGP